MDPREFIQERFGTDDTSTLLDEENYSRKELRRDKKKLQQSLKKKSKEQQEHEEKYKKLLQKGKNADEAKQREYATKAKFEKKKYKVKKKKHKADSIKLGTVVAIEGMRDVLEIQNEDKTNLEGALDDVDTQELETQVIDQMAEFGLEIDDMKAVQDALDIEVLEDDLESDLSDEMQLMQQMEADEISEEQIGFDEEVDTDSDDVDVDVDVDIDDDEDMDMAPEV